MKKKIIFTRFPLHSAFGGEEIVHVAMARFFASQKMLPFFLGSCPVMHKKFQEEEYSSVFFPFPKDITSKFSLLFSPFSVLFLFVLGFFFLGILRFCGAKQMICMSYIDKIALTFPAKIWGYEIFWGHHAALGKWFFSNPWKFFWKKFSAFATIFVPSNAIAQEMLFFCPSAKVKVIWNFVETPRISPKKLVQEMPTFGFLGRISEEKNIPFLLDLARFFPHHTFLVGGDGEKKSEYEAISPENVHFLGFLDEKKREKFWETIDIFLFPSKMETFGMVVAEAMMHEKFVVSSNLSALLEVMGNTGLTLPSKDAEAWKKAMHQILEDKNFRQKQAQNAKKRAENFFGLSAFQKRLEEVFLE